MKNTAIALCLFISSFGFSARAEVAELVCQFDIASGSGQPMANLYYQEENGSLTSISVLSDKLVQHLKAASTRTTTITVKCDNGAHSIELLKIDGVEWQIMVPDTKNFWIGTVPKSTVPKA